MVAKVSELTTDELREIIETSVERKLTEMLSDPDTGLEIQESLRHQLVLQEKQFQDGKRGKPLKDVVERLGLNKDNV